MLTSGELEFRPFSGMHMWTPYVPVFVCWVLLLLLLLQLKQNYHPQPDPRSSRGQIICHRKGFLFARRLPLHGGWRGLTFPVDFRGHARRIMSAIYLTETEHRGGIWRSKARGNKYSSFCIVNKSFLRGWSSKWSLFLETKTKQPISVPVAPVHAFGAGVDNEMCGWEVIA